MTAASLWCGWAAAGGAEGCSKRLNNVGSQREFLVVFASGPAVAICYSLLLRRGPVRWAAITCASVPHVKSCLQFYHGKRSKTEGTTSLPGCTATCVCFTLTLTRTTAATNPLAVRCCPAPCAAPAAPAPAGRIGRRVHSSAPGATQTSPAHHAQHGDAVGVAAQQRRSGASSTAAEIAQMAPAADRCSPLSASPRRHGTLAPLPSAGAAACPCQAPAQGGCRASTCAT